MRHGTTSRHVRPRIVMPLVLMTAAVAVGFTGTRFTYLPSTPSAVQAPLQAIPASYLGIFEKGSPPQYGPVKEFAQAVGKEPNLIGYCAGWAQPFDMSFARRMYRHGVTPFVQIDPTSASVSPIASGVYDHYLRSYADSVRSYRHPVVIGFGHEMNGTRYSRGYAHVPARVFVAAWRHIVTLFRGQGADNVTWLWTINAELPGTGPVSSGWPGTGYVTWVGIGGDYYHSSATFAGLFGRTIAAVRAFTEKPVLLFETGAGPVAGQAAKIGSLFAGMRQYQTLGLVWYDIAQHDGPYHQDWRTENSRAARAAFRRGAATLNLTRP
jgi:mannan endo-1,4-beta-mannosidase